MHLLNTKRNQYLFSVIVLLIVSSILALTNQSTSNDQSIFSLACSILLGPFSGWVLSIIDSSFLDALILNILVTTVTFIPIILLVTNKLRFTKILIIISLVLWLFSGFLFSVGIWI